MNLKSRLALVAILFILAFTIRIAYILQVKDLVIFYKGGAEAAFFQEWASIRQSVGWVDTSAPFREPLFPYLLGLVRMIWKNPLGLAIVEAVLGSVVAVLIYLVGERLQGRASGIVASIGFALYPLAIFSTATVNEGVLAALLLVLAFYMTIRKPVTSSAFYSGLVLGLGFLTRFMVAIAVVPLAIYLGLQDRSLARKTITALIVGLVIPVAFYQAVLLRSPQRCIFPTRSGWQFFLAAEGNTQAGGSAQATIEIDGQKIRTEVATDLLNGQNDAKRLAKVETGRQLDGGRLNLHWLKRGIKSSGKQATNCYLRRIGYLLGPYSPPSEFDLRLVASYAPMLKMVMWITILFFPLGILGIALSSNKESIGLASFCLIYGLVVPLLLVSQIDKLPLAAMLAIPFGGFCIQAYKSISNRLTKKSIATLLSAGALTIFLSFVGAKMDRSAQLVLLGNAYRDASLFEGAEKVYKEVLDQNPSCVDAYLHLSRLHANRRNPQAALQILEDALNRGVDNPKILLEKASMLLLLGRVDEAKAIALPLSKSQPLMPHINQVVGTCFLEQASPKEAIDYLVKEIDYGSANFITYGSLGQAYLQTGDYQQAASYLEAALRLRPPGTPPLAWVAMLADAYTGQGYHLKACNLLSEFVRSDVANIPLGFKFANCLYRAQRYEDALKQLKHLRQLAPTNTDILLNMGAVYVQLDSLDQAYRVWQEVLRIDPNNSTAKENLKELRR